MTLNSTYDPLPIPVFLGVIQYFSYWEQFQSETANIVFDNLTREHFLSQSSFSGLTFTLCDILSKYPSPDQFEQRNKELIREIRINLQLKGEVVDTEGLTAVGHVTTDINLMLGLNQVGGLKLGQDEIEDYVNDLLYLIKTKKSTVAQTEVPVRDPKVLVWLTWCPSMDNPDPFCELTGRSKEAYCQDLGLPEESASMELFSMDFNCTFLKQENCFIFRPTLCDADLRIEFRVPPVSENRHGLTWPGNLPEGILRGHHLRYQHLRKINRLSTLDLQTQLS